MRRPVVVLVAVVAVGLTSLVAGLAVRDAALVYTLGVPDTGVALQIARGQQACQEPVQVPDGATFDRVAVRVDGGTGELLVRDVASRQVLARGRIVKAPGQQRVRVGDVSPRGPVAVCLRGANGRIRVHGAAGLANRSSGVTLDDQAPDVDMLVALERRPRSRLSVLPLMAERAALWRPRFVGPWTYAVLGLLLVLGLPAALSIALRAAGTETGDDFGGSSQDDPR